MKFFKDKGILIIWIILILNLVLWFGSKVYFQDYFTSNYKYIAKISSLTATLLMAISLLLTTRSKFLEELFGGLDKVYSAHHNVGRWSLTLIILHPIFLSIINVKSFTDIILYYLPNFDNQYEIGKWVGSLALIFFFFLVYLTISAKIDYELWQKTHSWFGLLFSIVILHIVLVNSDIPKYPIFSIWYYTWLGIGLTSYLWTSFLRYYLGKKYNYQITKIERINPFYEITFKPIKEKIEHKPGQFLYTKFLDVNLPQEWHPYSIASFNEDGTIKMGIKELGDFTKQLNNLTLYSNVYFKGPYGKLGEKLYTHPQKEIVLIGGGVGITPMVSIWEYILKYKKNKNTLVYITNFESTATFNDDFIDLNNKYGINENDYWLYIDENKKFFTISDLQERIKNFDNKIFIVCGPPRLMNMLSTELKKKGVKNYNIVTENFSYGIGGKNWFEHINNLLTTIKRT
jgi:predicted ferric reductase